MFPFVFRRSTRSIPIKDYNLWQQQARPNANRQFRSWKRSVFMKSEERSTRSSLYSSQNIFFCLHSTQISDIISFATLTYINSNMEFLKYHFSCKEQTSFCFLVSNQSAVFFSIALMVMGIDKHFWRTFVAYSSLQNGSSPSLGYSLHLGLDPSDVSNSTVMRNFLKDTYNVWHWRKKYCTQWSHF